MKLPRLSISSLVSGQEKFLTMVLGAVAAYIQATHSIQDQDLKNLICALLVAAQGWLATNSGTATLEHDEVVAKKDDVDPMANTKPPARDLDQTVEPRVVEPGEIRR